MPFALFHWSKITSTPIILVVSKSTQDAFNMAADFSRYTGAPAFPPDHIVEARLSGSSTRSLVTVGNLSIHHNRLAPSTTIRNLIYTNRNYRTALFLHVLPNHVHLVPAYIRAHVDWLAVPYSYWARTDKFLQTWGFKLPPSKYATMTYLQDKRSDGSTRLYWNYQLSDNMALLMRPRSNSTFATTTFPMSPVQTKKSRPVQTKKKSKTLRCPKVYPQSIVSLKPKARPSMTARDKAARVRKILKRIRARKTH